MLDIKLQISLDIKLQIRLDIKLQIRLDIKLQIRFDWEFLMDLTGRNDCGQKTVLLSDPLDSNILHIKW